MLQSEISISDLITHKLASPVHALKFYADEDNLNGDDIKMPLEILESILNKSRSIYKFIRSSQKNWSSFFVNIVNYSYFFSPTGEALIEVDPSADVDDVLDNFDEIDQLFLKILEFAKINCSKVKISFSTKQDHFIVKFSKKLNYKDNFDFYNRLITTNCDDSKQLDEIYIQK